MGDSLTGEKIRRRRAVLGWSRVALARRAGCTDGAINAYERGSTPSPAAAAAVDHALAAGEVERFGSPAPAGPAPPFPRRPRSYRRPYTCRYCGGPAQREHGCCPSPACRARATRERAARHKPRPSPRPQADPALPPFGELIADDDGSRVQCHACGRFVVHLAAHAWGAHGLRAAAYRERYELARKTALMAPALRAWRSALATERGWGARLVARWEGSPHGGGTAGTGWRLEARVASSRQRRRDRDGGG